MNYIKNIKKDWKTVLIISSFLTVIFIIQFINFTYYTDTEFLEKYEYSDKPEEEKEAFLNTQKIRNVFNGIMLKDYGITKYIEGGRKKPIGILTYWLGHIGWGHLIHNLLFFILTAPAYISCIGRKKFFIYSAINILLGGILFTAYKYNSDICIIGFSGIAYMTLIGYALLSKNIFAIIIGIIYTLKTIFFCLHSLLTGTSFNGDLVHMVGIIIGFISVKQFIKEHKKEINSTV